MTEPASVGPAQDTGRQLRPPARASGWHPSATRAATESFLTTAESAHDEILDLFKERDSRVNIQVESKLRGIERRLRGVEGSANRKLADDLRQAFDGYAAAVRALVLGSKGTDVVTSFEAMVSSARAIHHRAATWERRLKAAMYVGTIGVSWLGAWLVASSIANNFSTKTAAAIIDRLPPSMRVLVEDTSKRDSMPLGSAHECTVADRATAPNLARDPSNGCAVWDVWAWRPDLQAGVELIPSFDQAVPIRDFGESAATLHGAKHILRNHAIEGKLPSLCGCRMEGGDTMRFVTWYDARVATPRVSNAVAGAPKEGKTPCETACR